MTCAFPGLQVSFARGCYRVSSSFDGRPAWEPGQGSADLLIARPMWGCMWPLLAPQTSGVVRVHSYLCRKPAVTRFAGF